MVSVLMIVAGATTAQQPYPSRPIRIMVTTSAGGGSDLIARMLAQKLAAKWGQSVIVENRPGGTGIIAIDAVAKAPPDGHTLLYATSSAAILPSLHPHLPYDTIKDFAPMCTLIITNYALVVHPSVPADTLREFIALARAKPGQLNYASVGTGGIVHLVSELFNIMARVDIRHIPYKGGAPAVTALIGGEVDMTFAFLSGVIRHIKSGRLKAIAIAGANRLPDLPQVPTFAQAGLPGYEANVWHALFAPAGTPKAIIDEVSSEIARVLAMPDIKEKLVSQGLEPFISTPEESAALLKSEVAKFAKIVKTANIKGEY